MVSLPLLYFLVSVSGASVLSLEILGTRILGPFFGVSLYLWSALITVTLAALSLGYALGGRYADRGPKLSRMAGLLALAGLWLLLIPWIKQPLLQLVEPFDLRAAVLGSALVLFAPPLVLLGMVTPYALRLKARSVERVGRDAGNLYAVSTIASVISALATGFWLIPYLGVLRLTIVVAVVLLLSASYAFWRARKEGARADAVLAATLSLLAALGGGTSLTHARTLPPGLLWVHDSPYSEIRVLDRPDGTYLLLDGGVHTIAGFGMGESHHRYVPVLESCELMHPEPGRMLLLGLGGGVVVQAYHQAGWKIDAVEIDPSVVEAAREFFGLRPHDAKIVVDDARHFLRESEEKWDLILVDAFGSSSIPFHLVSEEFFALAKAHLASNGLLAMNVECRQWYDPLVASVGLTMKQEFPKVWALPTQEPPNTLGNVVLLSAVDPNFELPEDKLPRPLNFVNDDYEHWRVVQMNHAWDNRFDPAKLEGAEVLSDDRNPVDLWSNAVNREARVELREFFGDSPQLR